MFLTYSNSHFPLFPPTKPRNSTQFNCPAQISPLQWRTDIAGRHKLCWLTFVPMEESHTPVKNLTGKQEAFPQAATAGTCALSFSVVANRDTPHFGSGRRPTRKIPFPSDAKLWILTETRDAFIYNPVYLGSYSPAWARWQRAVSFPTMCQMHFLLIKRHG